MELPSIRVRTVSKTMDSYISVLCMQFELFIVLLSCMCNSVFQEQPRRLINTSLLFVVPYQPVEHKAEILLFSFTISFPFTTSL